MPRCDAPAQDCRSAHNCVCTKAVPDVQTFGALLWSESPVVMTKLAGAFPGVAQLSGGLCIAGDGWIDRVQGFVDQLTRPERGALRAAPIDEQGNANPWHAAPAESLLQRARTPWLPALLNEDRLRIHFQPIFDLSRERLHGFEALIRGDVDGRLVSAGEIIEAARAHNALFQLDQKARTAAIYQGAARLQPGEKLFINFIPLVIYDPAICLRTTWEAVKRVGADLGSLVFEVVETEAFPDMNHLKHILSTYRQHGAMVALDDLGTGSSALAYIDELRPDLVKLARDLLPADPEPGDLLLLRGLVDHAHQRGITVLAEGIETERQLDAVRSLGVDLVQGYYLGKPQPEMVRTPLAPWVGATHRLAA